MNKQEIENKLKEISNNYWENKDLKIDNLQIYFLQCLKESFNLALELAAENAEIKEGELETESYKKADEFAEGKSYSYTTDMDGCLLGVNTFEVDKQSILDLKL